MFAVLRCIFLYILSNIVDTQTQQYQKHSAEVIYFQSIYSKENIMCKLDTAKYIEWIMRSIMKISWNHRVPDFYTKGNVGQHNSVD